VEQIEGRRCCGRNRPLVDWLACAEVVATNIPREGLFGIERQRGYATVWEDMFFDQIGRIVL